MSERRKYKRYTFICKVVFSPTENLRQKVKTKSVDISLGGVGLYLKNLIKRDTNLNLSIYHPKSGESIDAKGKLVWQSSASGDCRAGIQFTEIPYTKLKNLLTEVV